MPYLQFSRCDDDEHFALLLKRAGFLLQHPHVAIVSHPRPQSKRQLEQQRSKQGRQHKPRKASAIYRAADDGQSHLFRGAIVLSEGEHAAEQAEQGPCEEQQDPYWPHLGKVDS